MLSLSLMLQTNLNPYCCYLFTNPYDIAYLNDVNANMPSMVLPDLISPIITAIR